MSSFIEQSVRDIFNSIKSSLSGIYTAIQGGINTYTTIGHSVKTVATAGTDEALATSTVCKSVSIQAQTDNTGLIAIGASGVDATVSTGTGVVLFPGEVYTLEISNLSTIYIDATVSGDGVRYTYLN